MGIRKGYPFSRRAYKQGWGILSKSIFGLLGLGACAAKGIKDAVESNAISANNDTHNSTIPNIENKNKAPRISNGDTNDKKIISDNIANNDYRCLSVEEYIISGEYKSDYASASLSCFKRENGNPYYHIKIRIMQRDFVYVLKGEIMLIKLDNEDILEFKNMFESKSDTRRYGQLITLSYHISEEQINNISEHKITKMRVSFGSKYKNINVSASDLSMYISKSYTKIMDRLSKKPSIYEGF